MQRLGSSAELRKDVLPVNSPFLARRPPLLLITHHVALALAGTGRWEEAIPVAENHPRGPSGPSLIVLAAGRARSGDLAGARHIATQLPGDPDFLDRVAMLLRMGGEAPAARALLAASASPPGG